MRGYLDFAHFEAIPFTSFCTIASTIIIKEGGGRVLLTPTFFAGKPAIRAAFVNWSTSEQDIRLVLNALEGCART